jgi:hypothetical protein
VGIPSGVTPLGVTGRPQEALLYQNICMSQIPYQWDTLAAPGIEPGMAACPASWLTIKPDDISANKLFLHIFYRDHKY